MRVPVLERGHVLARRFVIRRCIGTGGMGVVYEAADRRLGGRSIAIKTVHEVTEAALKRFEAEATAAAQIDSPFVVRVYDFFEEGGVPFMTMEYLEGRNLKKVLESGPLPVATAVDIILGAAQAVFEAHLAGISHRDLTPDNVFVVEGRSGDGVRVLDFGLSMSSKATRVTGAHQLVCTPMYVAPERIGGKEGDPRSDQYSLAVVLYEALAGQPPFVEVSGADEILMAVATRTAPRVDEIRKDLDSGLVDVIARGMERSPDERFRSVHAFGRALLPFASPEGRAAHRPYFEAAEPVPRVAMTLTGGTTMSERVAELNAIKASSATRSSQWVHDAPTRKHDYAAQVRRSRARRGLDDGEGQVPRGASEEARSERLDRSSVSASGWVEEQPRDTSVIARRPGGRRRRRMILAGVAALAVLTGGWYAIYTFVPPAEDAEEAPLGSAVRQGREHFRVLPTSGQPGVRTAPQGVGRERDPAVQAGNAAPGEAGHGAPSAPEATSGAAPSSAAAVAAGARSGAAPSSAAAQAVRPATETNGGVLQVESTAPLETWTPRAPGLSRVKRPLDRPVSPARAPIRISLPHRSDRLRERAAPAVREVPRETAAPIIPTDPPAATASSPAPPPRRDVEYQENGLVIPR